MDRRGEVSRYGELVDMASTAKPFKAFIDPDNDLFYSPGQMPEKIQQFCKDTGQEVPETKAEILRCVFESLAMKYRWSMEKTGRNHRQEAGCSPYSRRRKSKQTPESDDSQCHIQTGHLRTCGSNSNREPNGSSYGSR